MFDIGFSEIVVIAVVALIVIGPEKLPKTARTLGHLFGRLQRYVNDVKADINREIELDELRKLQQEVQDRGQGHRDVDLLGGERGRVERARGGVRPQRRRRRRADPRRRAAEMRPLSGTRRRSRRPPSRRPPRRLRPPPHPRPNRRGRRRCRASSADSAWRQPDPG